VKNFPFKKYSIVQIVLTNLEACVSTMYPLKKNPTEKKDLRLKSNLNPQKNYSVVRGAEFMLKNEKHDISSESEYIIIESLQ